MAQDPISARYADALFESVKAEQRVEETMRQLEELARLLREHAPLRQLLGNPDIEIPDKLRVLRRLLEGLWSEPVEAFLHVVLTLGRVEALPEMVDAFRGLADRERGVARVTVRTARPLSSSLRSRLLQALARRERRTVELVEETDHDLLGGVQVLLDHRMLDGSLRTQLGRLRRRLKQVRV